MELHRSTCQSAQIHRGLFDDLLRPHVAIVEGEVRKLDPAFNLGPLVEALWTVFRGRYIPLVRTHGDFGPENLIVSQGAKVTGIPDWEASVNRGWPMLDLLSLIAVQNKWRGAWYFGSVVTGRLMPGWLASWEREMVEEYCAALGMEGNLWHGFVTLYWLEIVSQYIQTDYNETWLTRNAIRPLPKIIAGFSRRGLVERL